MTITFLHTSDLQIGMTRKFLDADAQATYSRSRVKAISKMGALAKERGCDFMVMAGDVFEHNALSAKTFGTAVEELKKVPVPVYILSGNHDPLGADSQLLKITGLDHVHVFTDSEPIVVDLGDRTAELIGAPLRTKRASHDLVADAIKDLEETDTPRVVVGHGQVEARTNDFQPDLINLGFIESKLESRAIDYVALGDTHSTQSLGDSGKVWFSGAPETTDFHELLTGGGENDSGNALIVSIDKPAGATSTVEVEKVPVGEWVFEAPVYPVNTREEAEEFISYLEAQENKDTTVIKYALVGTIDLATSEYLNAQLGRLTPVFASLYERERLMDLHLEPTEDDLANLELEGFLKKSLAQLIEEASYDEDQATRSVDEVAESIEQAHHNAEGDGQVDTQDSIDAMSDAEQERLAARDAINLLFRLTQQS